MCSDWNGAIFIMMHHRESSMPSCIVVCFLVFIAAPTSSFYAAASSSNRHAHRPPTLKWKQRGAYDARERHSASKVPVDKWGDVTLEREVLQHSDALGGVEPWSLLK